MFKKFLLICAVICSTAFCYSCSKDDPGNPKQEENKEPEKPTKDEDGEIIYVKKDGTTSNGAKFSWLTENESFMLNHVQYGIVNNHLEVFDLDYWEIEDELKGNVEIVPTVVLPNDVTYKVQKVRLSDSDTRFKKILKTVILPNTIQEIGHYAFKNCINLEKINIPDAVRKIGGYAFWNCKIKTITLSKSLKEIDEYAFYGCENLTDIYCRSSNPPYIENNIANTSIMGGGHIIKLHVPLGSLETYKEDKMWGFYFHYIEEYKVED